MTRYVLPLALLLTACRAPASTPPPSPEPATRVPEAEPESKDAEVLTPVQEGWVDAPFGGEQWGFVMAATDNKRFVFIRRFPGEPPENMGHHGDAAMETELTAFDRVEGTERALAGLVDLDDTRRFVIAMDTSGETLLLDAESGTWDTLEASKDPDMNRCLSSRTAVFSPDSTRVGYVEPGNRTFTVRDLASGDTFAVEASAGTVIWRGWPHDDDPRATLALVPEGSDPAFPKQRTSCACTYCGRFAMSQGFYGWDGPTFDLVEATPGEPATSVDAVPERRSAWLGKGCRVKPSEKHGDLERGPWRWVCE